MRSKHWFPLVLSILALGAGVVASAQATGAATAPTSAAATAEKEPADPTIESKYRIGIDLKAGYVDRTLPFDVPFLLFGKTDKADLVGIRAHAFEAPHAFRIEQGEEMMRCVRQGPLRRKELRQAAWPRDFNPAATTTTVATTGPKDATDEDAFVCGRWPNVASWNRPPTAEGEANANFSLRVPPLDPNHHFVFVLELERKPDPVTLDELKQKMAAIVSAALVETAKSIEVEEIRRDDYEKQLRRLRSELRRLLNDEVQPYVIGGRDEEWSFFEPRSPFDLALKSQLIDTLALAYDIQTQIKSSRDRWQELKNEIGPEGTSVPGLPQARATEARELLAGNNPFGEGKLATNEVEKLKQLTCNLVDLSGLALEVAAPSTDLCDAIDHIETTLTRAPEAAKVINKLKIEADKDLILLEANSVGSFETRQTRHFNIDIGVLSAPDLDGVFPYIGTNIYRRPVNKDAPLTGFEPWKRCGLTVGATFFENFGEDDDRVKPLFSNSALVAGAGCRLNEYARLGGGVLVFRENDPDPLIDDDKLSCSPYVSLSIDWDVYESFDWLRRLFSGLGSNTGGQ